MLLNNLVSANRKVEPRHKARQKARAVGRESLVERVQVFTGFESYGPAGCNADLGPGSRIASDSSLAGPHVEYAEATQLDAVPICQRALETLEYGFDSSLGFYAGQSGTLNYLMYDVLLNQWLSPETRTRNAASPGIEKMLERILRIVNAWYVS